MAFPNSAPFYLVSGPPVGLHENAPSPSASLLLFRRALAQALFLLGFPRSLLAAQLALLHCALVGETICRPSRALSFWLGRSLRDDPPSLGGGDFCPTSDNMRSEKLSGDARDVHHNIGLFLPILLMLASSPIVFGNATKATDYLIRTDQRRSQLCCCCCCCYSATRTDYGQKAPAFCPISPPCNPPATALSPVTRHSGNSSWPESSNEQL